MERNSQLYDLPVPILSKLADNPFYQELAYLAFNKEFRKCIDEVRQKRKILIKPLPKLKQGDFLAKITTENATLLADILPIVERCKLGKDKYKPVTIEAVMSHLLYNNLTPPSVELMLSKMLTPTFSSTLDNVENEVTVTIKFPLKTNITPVRKVLKENWYRIEDYQIKYKKTRLSPKRQWIEGFKWYRKHEMKGLSYQDILNESAKLITKEGIIQGVKRIKNKINSSFN